MYTIEGKTYDSMSYFREFKEQILEYSSLLQKGGSLPPGCDNYTGIVTLILFGIDRGISPTAALDSFSLIKGRPSMSAKAMLGYAVTHGGVSYEFTEDTPTAVTIVVSRNGRKTEESRFSMDDAKKAGLYPPDKAGSAWAKWPQQMLKARAITQGLRYIASDVLTGIRCIEELQDEIEDASPREMGKTDYEKIADQPQVKAPKGKALESKVLDSGHTEAQIHQAVVNIGAKVVATNLDMKSREEVKLVVGANSVPNLTETGKNIKTALNNLGLSDEEVVGLVSPKVAELGAKNLTKLAPADFMQLYHWVCDYIKEAKKKVAPEVAGEAIPQFDPNQTKKLISKIQGASVADLEKEIFTLWEKLTEAGEQAGNLAAEIVSNKYDFEAENPNNTVQTCQLLLAELRQVEAGLSQSVAV